MALRLIIFILLFICSVIISFQDFRTRLLSVWAVVLYGITTISFVLYFQTAMDLLSNTISTAIYFLFVFLVLFLYYYVKEGRLTNIIDTRIGLGDILIFLAIGITLDLINLIVFFTISFAISVFLGILLFRKDKSIPLAGILVWCHILFMTICKKEFLIGV